MRSGFFFSIGILIWQPTTRDQPLLNLHTGSQTFFDPIEEAARIFSFTSETTWDALDMWSDLQIAPFGSMKCGVWGKLAVATQKARE